MQILKFQNHLKFVLYKTYVVYQKFIKICISFLALFGGSHVTKNEDQFDIDLKDFLQEKYAETDLEELISKFDSAETKNIIKSTNDKKIRIFVDS